MFLKNRNISSKIKRSKVTDYAALNLLIGILESKLYVCCMSKIHPAVFKMLVAGFLFSVHLACNAKL